MSRVAVGFGVVDLWPHFSAHPAEVTQLDLLGHPSVVGHEIAAKVLRKMLLEEYSRVFADPR